MGHSPVEGGWELFIRRVVIWGLGARWSGCTGGPEREGLWGCTVVREGGTGGPEGLSCRGCQAPALGGNPKFPEGKFDFAQRMFFTPDISLFWSDDISK